MKSLAFLVTDKCNISCDFCAPGCGPKLNGHLDADFMFDVFERLHCVGHVPVVIFTGGEPLLYKKDVLQTIKNIRKLSDTPIRIVTNAFWANKPEKAKVLLSELKEAGLTELNYSVDDFHQAYIPLSTVKIAVDTALELNIRLHLAHKTYPGSKSNREFYENVFGYSIPYLSSLDSDKLKISDLTMSTGYTLAIGRGSDRVLREDWVPHDFTEERWQGPCFEVLKNITISANRYLTPCCGLVDRSLKPFYVASVSEYDILEVLEHANKSVLYNWLALEGPSEIMKFIIAKDPSQKFFGRYSQNCEICQEIFSDTRKSAIVEAALPEKSKQLSIMRCAFESTRISLRERKRQVMAPDKLLKGDAAKKRRAH